MAQLLYGSGPAAVTLRRVRGAAPKSAAALFAGSNTAQRQHPPMVPAFLTAVFFALSVVCASRSARLLGATGANYRRLLVSLLLLGIWAHVWGHGLGGKTFFWFFLSGSIGFGLGDMALYQALAAIGPRLAVILVQCLAVPFAACIERLWLGTAVNAGQAVCGFVILAGVAIALGESSVDLAAAVRLRGTLFGIAAALGQAAGAVVSRKAYLVAALLGEPVDGGTAAYERMIGGVLATSVFYLALLGRNQSRRSEGPRLNRQNRAVAWRWVVLNALAGATLGVSCYQWALSTTPSAIVLPIVALAPIITIPLAFALEGDKPTLRSVLGGIIAVAGAIQLTRM